MRGSGKRVLLLAKAVGDPGCTTVGAGKRGGSLSCRCCSRETCVGVWGWLQGLLRLLFRVAADIELSAAGKASRRVVKSENPVLCCRRQ